MTSATRKQTANDIPITRRQKQTHAGMAMPAGDGSNVTTALLYVIC